VLDLNQQPTNYEFAAQTIMLTAHRNYYILNFKRTK
jgi:hypothetical protein